MRFVLAMYLASGGMLWLAASVRSQEPQNAGTQASSPQPPGEQSPADLPTTVFPHSETSRFWVSGQVNFIEQWHPSFHSPYQGPLSLTPEGEHALSRVFTLFTGVELTSYAEVLFQLESAGGKGIGNGFGLAGFTNLDVVHNPSLGSKPYVGRTMLHFAIPLSHDRTPTERNSLSVFRNLPARRLEIRLGKFQLVDFFDLNSAGSDSHLQFLNLTIDNNGAYDYAADTRGYTVAAMLDFEEHNWGIRFAEALMPRQANFIDLEWNLSRARSENIEFELRKGLLPSRNGVVRLMSYINHANMGDYRVAIRQFESGETAVPDVTNHPFRTTTKYGFGANLEQSLNGWLTAFGRVGWNEGRQESFAYTEVNQAATFGIGANGKKWRRGLDRAGAAFSSNAISGDHRLYLALGGKGFLLGDGHLNYGRENIIEMFYTIHVWRGVYGAFDLQHINNPGYNRDRGPVLVPAVRLHLDL
jgi:high affinity Mn2+ porin